MRCLVLAVMMSGLPLLAQTDAQPTTTYHTQDGGTSGVMESIFIPPIAAAPFTLTLDTDWSRPLSGGGTMTLSNQRHIARDGYGRIYQERWVLVPKGGKIRSTMNAFQVMDPAQHTLFNCFPGPKVCELSAYRLLSTATYEPHVGTSGRLPDGSGTRTVEALGVANTAGVDTTGTRTTTTIDPGQMGNDRPMVTTREFWYSAHLGVNLISLVDAPQSGRQSFRVTELTTSEPDPRLFAVPDGYRVVDTREAAPEAGGGTPPAPRLHH